MSQPRVLGPDGWPANPNPATEVIAATKRRRLGLRQS